jgi:hypothetical protein
VTASSRIELARGTITKSDSLAVELVQGSDTPPAVLIHWPAAPSVVAPSPKAVAYVATSVVRILAEAQAQLAKIRSKRAKRCHAPPPLVLTPGPVTRRGVTECPLSRVRIDDVINTARGRALDHRTKINKRQPWNVS